MQKSKQVLLKAKPQLTLENMKAIQNFYHLVLLVMPDLAQEKRELLMMALVRDFTGIDLEQSQQKKRGIPEELWTATELAEEFGVSPQKVGWVANRHGLKSRTYGRSRMAKSRYSGCPVVQFCYNQRGRERLAKLINAELVD